MTGFTIQVELFGHFREGRAAQQIVRLDQPVPARSIALQLGLDPAEVGLVVMNGIQCELEDIILPDCRICFFPPLSGG